MVDSTDSPQELNLEPGEQTPKSNVTPELKAYFESMAKNMLEGSRKRIAQLEAQVTELKQAKPSEEPKPSKKVEDPELAALKADNAKRAAREAKLRDAQLRSAVKEQAIKGGVHPDAADTFAGYLVDSKKMVSYQSEDSDDISVTIGEESFSLDQGMDQVLKTDKSAAFFLAPKQVAGSGGTHQTGNQKPQADELDKSINRLLGL
jgi:hypothetical protein